MPALRQIRPIILKELLEAAEWSIYSEDKLNWSLVNGAGESVEVPKRGRFVSTQVMEHILSQAELLPGDYFSLLALVQEARRLRGVSEDGIESQPRGQ